MARYLACGGGDGIRVNAVAPWFIRTPLPAVALAGALPRGAARDAPRSGGRAARGRVRRGLPRDGCRLIITGQVVGVDGGMMQEGFRYVRE